MNQTHLSVFEKLGGSTPFRCVSYCAAYQDHSAKLKGTWAKEGSKAPQTPRLSLAEQSSVALSGPKGLGLTLPQQRLGEKPGVRAWTSGKPHQSSRNWFFNLSKEQCIFWISLLKAGQGGGGDGAWGYLHPSLVQAYPLQSGKESLWDA